ncbi:hypothetical protein RQP46_007666 [Phenoliferia psychrophenolica]
MRDITGDDRYETALERTRRQVPFSLVFKDTLQRPFLMLVIVIFGDLIAFPLIFRGYGLTTDQEGLTFASIAVGMAIVAACAPLIYNSYVAAEVRERKATGNPFASPPPEERLRLAMLGTWCLPISLFWFAWTCDPSVPIWVPLASQIFFGIGILSCFISSYQYIIDAYQATAASGLAVLTVVRYPISGAAVLFTGPLYSKLGNHWALTLFGIMSIPLSMIPWVFFRYGAQIRSWSRYTSKI